MAPPHAIVFVVTPRLGDENYRNLVPTTSPPDDQQVQNAFEARQKVDDRQPGQSGSEDVLAVEHDVSQRTGRIGTEWLIVRDPRIRRLPAARRAELRSLMQARLATLTLPAVSEAAAASECVPFQPIDDIRRWIDTELGPPITPTPQRRRWFMTIAILASGVMAVVGLVMIPRDGDPPLPDTEPTSSLAKDLDFENEQAAIALLRELVVPNLPPDKDLLATLNEVRPLIAGASVVDYESNAKVLQDERLKSAVKELRKHNAFAFLDKEGRGLLAGLNPNGVQKLFGFLKTWPDHARDMHDQDHVFKAIEDAIGRVASEAKKRRIASQPHMARKIFVYEDSKFVAPILMKLFVTGNDAELTALGKRLSDGAPSKPESLADWFTEAALAYEGKRDEASLWLSETELKKFEARAQDRNLTQGSDSNAGQFYAHLAELLKACSEAVSNDAPPPSSADAARPAEQKAPSASPPPQPR